MTTAHTWMNEDDILVAAARFNKGETPNLGRGARILSRLMEWTNNNSDGWPYWMPPARAANRLMLILQRSTTAYYSGGLAEDITDAELRAVLSPIKTFLTRRNVEHGTILDDPPPHNIDVFRAGGGSDGEPRYLPACLTCNRSIGPVCENYGIALALATAHREQR
jgi:hypothetical protein